MTDISKEKGTIAALVQRLETLRLPRALELKEKVDRGELLGDMEIEFLQRVLEDTRHIQPLAASHPDWQPLVVRVLALYKSITEKALENEKSAGTSQP